MQHLSFEVRFNDSEKADVDAIEKELKKELASIDGLSIEGTRRDRSQGMTGIEIAISFVVSFVASTIANAYQPEISAAIRRAAGKTGAGLRAVFPKKKP